MNALCKAAFENSRPAFENSKYISGLKKSILLNSSLNYFVIVVRVLQVVAI